MSASFDTSAILVENMATEKRAAVARGTRRDPLETVVAARENNMLASSDLADKESERYPRTNYEFDLDT